MIVLCAALFFLLTAAIAGTGQTVKRPALIFTQIYNPVTRSPDCIDGFRASILVFDKNVWRIASLPVDGYENSDWQFAGRTKTGRDVWAFAEYAVEGRGWNLEVTYSADDGRTWRHIGSLKKIYYTAEFYSFTMSGGKAQLTVKLSDGNDPNNKDGYYSYATINKGATWSKPKYSQTPLPEGKNSIEKISPDANVVGTRCADVPNWSAPGRNRLAALQTRQHFFEIVQHFCEIV